MFRMMMAMTLLSSIGLFNAGAHYSPDLDQAQTEACAAAAYGIFAETMEVREGHALPKVIALYSKKTMPRAIVVKMDGCPPCKQLEEGIRKELAPPNGKWKVGVSETDDIQFIDHRKFKLVRVRSYPSTIIVDGDNKVLRVMDGSESTPTSIAKAINTARGIKMYREVKDTGAKMVPGEESVKASSEPPKESSKTPSAPTTPPSKDAAPVSQQRYEVPSRGFFRYRN